MCTDVARLQELNREKEGNEAELAELYEKWEELSLEAAAHPSSLNSNRNFPDSLSASGGSGQESDGPFY